MTVRHPPLVQAMLDPRVYPHPVERVELIETHISWVFLAGEHVYKIKKPVDLGFLDNPGRGCHQGCYCRLQDEAWGR